MEPHETALEFLTKISRCIPVPELSFMCNSHHQIRAGEVLCLCGRAGSGKTAIAMYCVIQAILPKHLGGAELTAAWFDTNGNFDVVAIRELLLERCTAASSQSQAAQAAPASQEDIEGMVGSAMRRLLVFDCATPIDLLLAARKLYDTCQANKKLGMLVIDSVSTHWHMDKTMPNLKRAVYFAFQLLTEVRRRFQVCSVLSFKSLIITCH